MSTCSLSDADDAQETARTRLVSQSDDELSGSDGSDPKPRPSKTRNRSKNQQNGVRTQRHAANARERARMRVLAKAFSRLKTSLPWVPADTKLSKLDTLRLASSYINHLRQLLHQDKQGKNPAHPVNLSWPFLMSGRADETKENSSFRLCGATA